MAIPAQPNSDMDFQMPGMMAAGSRCSLSNTSLLQALFTKSRAASRISCCVSFSDKSIRYCLSLPSPGTPSVLMGTWLENKRVDHAHPLSFGMDDHRVQVDLGNGVSMIHREARQVGHQLR